MLWGGRNAANKYHWLVWGVLAVSGPHWVCPNSWDVCFASLHCSGSRLLCRERALGCMHFPGLNRSCSGSRVLDKGTDSVGPAFCAFPRSEQLRQPGVLQANSPQVLGRGVHLITSPVPAAWFPGWQQVCASQLCHVSLLGADLWLWPSWWMSTIQNPKKSWLATGSLLAVW